jgi:hypothetical protein
MKRVIAFVFVAALAALPSAAQSTAVGIQVGISQQVNSGIEFDEFDDDLKEIFVSFAMDTGTAFKIKAGEIETNDGLRIGAPGITDEGTIQYLTGVVEYRFYEVFGSTALFAGAGGYRQKFGTFEETDFGLTAGVNALFPVTRRFGVLAEAAYHWVDFDNSRRLLTGSVGLRIGF